MKIAILSMQRVLNAGSVLQAYSLRSILREMGVESVSFLDIDGEKVLPSIKTVQESDDYNRTADYSRGIVQRVKNGLVYRLSKYNKHLLRRFMKQELNLEEERCSGAYDGIVVGSDEVFNHARGINLQLHGEVSAAPRIISYAASCGSARIQDIYPEHLACVRKAMENFAAVSVRDTATQEYVASLYDGRIERHLDPVLVGPLRKRTPAPVFLKNYLLIYAYGLRIRTKEEIDAIKTFAKARNLKVVAVGGSQVWCDLYIPASPFRVLDYFHYADYIVTDTFHGTIFSVINHKKFGVIMRRTNRGKLSSLLDCLGLEQREIKNMDNLTETLMADIDYDRVDAILEEERARTRKYLKEQLGV